jgi:hypothetical protein
MNNLIIILDSAQRDSERRNGELNGLHSNDGDRHREWRVIHHTPRWANQANCTLIFFILWRTVRLCFRSQSDCPTIPIISSPEIASSARPYTTMCTPEHKDYPPKKKLPELNRINDKSRSRRRCGRPELRHGRTSGTSSSPPMVFRSSSEPKLIVVIGETV